MLNQILNLPKKTCLSSILSAVCIVVAFISGVAATGGASGGPPNEPSGYLAILAIVFSVISTLVDGRASMRNLSSRTS